jgi:hypothetical protein
MEHIDKKLSQSILSEVQNMDQQDRDARLKGATEAQKDVAQGVREAIIFMLYTADLSFKSLSTTLRHLRAYSHINDEYIRTILFKLKEERLVKFDAEEGVWKLDQCTLML